MRISDEHVDQLIKHAEGLNTLCSLLLSWSDSGTHAAYICMLILIAVALIALIPQIGVSQAIKCDYVYKHCRLLHASPTSSHVILQLISHKSAGL